METSLKTLSHWSPQLGHDEIGPPYTAASIDNNMDIYVLDMTREILTRLTFVKSIDLLPIWTPDGKRFVFVSDREGPRGIYWKPADGTGEAEKLSSTPDKNLFPWCWSNDGNTLLWRNAGYHGKLIFLSLPTADLAIARVLSRVAQGGHNVPEEVVRRRFDAGLRNFQEIYRELASSWVL